MYSNNNGNNNNNSNSPYGYNGYRQSGGRIWGMSHSLPSGMDNEYNQPQYPGASAVAAAAAAAMNSRRGGYNDFSPNGSGGNNLMGNLGGGGNGSGNGSNNGSNNSGNNSGNMGGNTNSSSGSSNSSTTSSNNSSSGSNGGEGSNNGTNLIVNYLPQDMTDRELYALFRTIGPINTCRIMRDYKTGYSFGYAFVDFTSEADSQRAIKSLNGITVRNKRLKVSYARPGGESIKDTNLYVTNLPRTITDDQLETIFGKYGSIVQKNILRDKLTGKPRGVAFVRYNKREEAQEAISALNNVIPEGGSQPLTVRLAEEHGKAKAAHFMNQISMGGGPGGAPSMNAAGYNNLVQRGRRKRFQPYHNPHKFF